MRLAWVVPAAALSYVLAQALAGGALAATPLEPPRISPGASPGRQMVWALVSAIILTLGVAPLAVRLSGTLVHRWLLLAALLYTVHAVNTAIEITIFTRLGGEGYVAALGVLPALALAGVLAAGQPGSALAGAVAGPHARWEWRGG